MNLSIILTMKQWWLWCIVFIACGGCAGMEKSERTLDLPWQDLREGDLLFRRGEGVASHFVLIADKGGVYSHIGILVKDSGSWKVVHAVPGEPDYENEPDRVKMEPVERFFNREHAACGAVMRVDCDSLQASRAAAHAKQLVVRKVLFDHTYNREDTTALYCTELVELVFDGEGIDLAKKCRTKVYAPGLNGDDYLFPSDIANSEKVKCLYAF